MIGTTPAGRTAILPAALVKLGHCHNMELWKESRLSKNGFSDQFNLERG